MRMTFHFLLALFLFTYVVPATANQRDVKICLTGGTEKIILTYGNAFLNGATLALQEINNPNFRFLIEESLYDPTPLAPRRKIESLFEQNCSVLIGFSTMSDLLTIKDFAREKGTVVISIYGETDTRFADVPNIMTLQPPPEFLIDRFSQFLKHKLPQRQKRALVITAIDQESFLGYRAAYLSFLKQQQIAADSLDFIERPFNLDRVKSQISDRARDYDVVFLLGRSANSASIADMITELRRPDPPPLFIGTKFFGSPQFPGFLDKLTNKDVTAYFPHNGCVCDSDPKYQAYVGRYRKTFGKEPGIISAGAFDAVRFVTNASRHLSSQGNKSVSAKEFYAAAKKTISSGISGVTLGPNFKSRYSKHFIFEVRKDGYYVTDSSGKLLSE